MWCSCTLPWVLFCWCLSSCVSLRPKAARWRRSQKSWQRSMHHFLNSLLILQTGGKTDFSVLFLFSGSPGRTWRCPFSSRSSHNRARSTGAHIRKPLTLLKLFTFCDLRGRRNDQLYIPAAFAGSHHLAPFGKGTCSEKDNFLNQISSGFTVLSFFFWVKNKMEKIIRNGCMTT